GLIGCVRVSLWPRAIPHLRGSPLMVGVEHVRLLWFHRRSRVILGACVLMTATVATSVALAELGHGGEARHGATTDARATIDTVAGIGIDSVSEDGIPARTAAIRPHGLAYDSQRRLLYVLDAARLRVIDSSGIIHAVAGSVTFGYGGDGGAP